MILQSEAIILSAKRFSETSLIVVAYSKEKGKFSAIVKGALSTKNKFGISLQPLSISHISVYWKENRELQTLSNAEISQKVDKIFLSLEKMSAGLAIIEFLNASVANEDPNNQIFELIKNSLVALSNSEKNKSVLPEVIVERLFAKVIKLHFFVNLYTLLGYGLQVECCGMCQKKIVFSGGNVAFSIALGSLLCAACRERTSFRPISFSAITLLNNILDSNFLSSQIHSGINFENEIVNSINLENQGLNVVVKEKDIAELDEIIYALIRHHIEGIRNSKVSKVVNEII